MSLPQRVLRHVSAVWNQSPRAVGAVGQAGQANYAASKAGLVGLARSLAREYAGRGVTSNVLTPGLVETDMWQRMDRDWSALQGVPRGQAWQQRVAAVPMGRR